MPRSDDRPVLSAVSAAPRRRHGLARLLGKALLVAFLLPVPFVAVYRFLPPPVTPLMIIRSAEGEPLRKQWMPLNRLSPWLLRAVIASEDARFCRHHGFDWVEIADAIDRFRAGGRLRGASTISTQTAKNLFLWPGRSILRKAIEPYLTVLIELTWPKSRILEVYLNVIEWGHGVYGAEAAAQAHFHKPALALTRREAALLAAILPNPRELSADHPSAYLDERAAVIEARLSAVEIPGVPTCR